MVQFKKPLIFPALKQTSDDKNDKNKTKSRAQFGDKNVNSI